MIYFATNQKSNGAIIFKMINLYTKLTKAATIATARATANTTTATVPIGGAAKLFETKKCNVFNSAIWYERKNLHTQQYRRTKISVK